MYQCLVCADTATLAVLKLTFIVTMVTILLLGKCDDHIALLPEMYVLAFYYPDKDHD